MNDIGAPPELAWLPVDKLSVDPSYQRTLETRRSQALIEKIAANFRWVAFQAVLTVKTADGWTVIDGQHRVEAAKRCGVERVPAVVVVARSVAEQAAAFVQANLDRVTVTPYALHHARLAAGDPAAQAIDRCCRASGLSIPRYPLAVDNMKPGQTMALGSIGRAVKQLGEEDATIVFKSITAALGQQAGSIRAPLVLALTQLWALAPPDTRAVLFARVTRWLKGQTPEAMYANAVQRKHRHGGTESSQLLELVRRGAGGMHVAPPVRTMAAARAAL